ncbi:MAG: hypothetical protein PHC34_13230 [Candidatus Gastranaerophilales bacterium]|nr:hypothetical protein [Candidatus Gastranaerophilales bacterium]
MKKYIVLTLLILFAQACKSKRYKEITGRYYKVSSNLNYLDINENGTYFHYYKNDSLELSQEGLWKISQHENSVIELSNWKNYNELGKDYEDYNMYLLFINGNFLNVTPDGNAASSFEKKR